jgi:hypothetical protein
MDSVSADEESRGPEPDGEKNPFEYGIDAPVWLIGHEPRNRDEWILEVRLWAQREARENHRRREEQRVQGLQQAAEKEKEWATGRRPSNDREWELEYTFRQLENQRESGNQERELRYRVTLDAAKQAAQGAAVRSWVLLAIVAAIILMPVVGMLVGIQAQTFSQFIAPVTGIGGTVLGYWFGQRTSGAGLDVLPPPDQSQSSAALMPSFPAPTSSSVGPPSSGRSRAPGGLGGP